MADTQTVANRLERRLEDQVTRYQKAQRNTILIGLVPLLIIVIYFSILISQVNDLTRPQSVSDMAVGYASEKLPELRRTLTNDLTQNADKYLNAAADELLASLADGRREIEQFATKEFAGYLAQLKGDVYDLADYTFETHSERIHEMLTYLESNEDTSEFEDEMVAMLTADIYASNAHVDLRAYALTLDELAQKVDRLRRGEAQDEAERLERELLVALKELSNRSGEPLVLKLPESPRASD